jgi:two-component system, NtrC family, sensor kinase
MRIFNLIPAIFCFVVSQAQNVETDSLKKVLDTTRSELKRIYILEGLSYAYLSSSPDSSLYYASEGLALAIKNNDVQGQSFCTTALGNVYFGVGDYPKALEMYLKALHMKEGLKNQRFAVIYFNLANIYTEQQDYRNAIIYMFKAKREDEKESDSSGVLFDLYSLSSVYLRKNDPDSAIYYSRLAIDLGNSLQDKNLMGAILNNHGEIYILKNDIGNALRYYQESIPYADSVNDMQILSANFLGLAKIFRKTGKYDSAALYAMKALNIAHEATFLRQVYDDADFLTDLFKTRGKYDSAFKYLEIGMAARDSLFNIDKVKKVQNLKLQEQERQQAIEAAGLRLRNRIKLYSVIFISLVFFVIVVLLWRNNKQRKKAYEELELQKIRTDEAYEELKATQTQLIHAEKMASLGELTAGIAHEIQNPLNFVNNFSEISNELMGELKSELDKGDTHEAISIVETVQHNLEKVLLHGKRADSIVKSMLQHSKTSSGQMELTDINSLVVEYLKLAYQRVRSKDKSIYVKLETELDSELKKAKIIPQEIARVILNLLNNAFYAVNEKKKLDIPGYEAMIKIQTRKLDDEAELIVSDNGIGIPEKNLEKIFQPFFTTKPTGQGTGLGLSLAFDIVTKGHRGEIKVESREGVGSIFVILLPMQ